MVALLGSLVFVDFPITALDFLAILTILSVNVVYVIAAFGSGSRSSSKVVSGKVIGLCSLIQLYWLMYFVPTGIGVKRNQNRIQN